MANDFSGDANCIAVYNMEPGALTADSKGANTLTNVGFDENAVDFKQGSGSGQSIRANADRMYITHANQAADFPGKVGYGTFSFTFWVKFTGTISDSQYLLNKPSSKIFLVQLTASKVRFYISTDGTNWNSYTMHDTALVAGRWYHVGVTYNISDGATRIRIWDDTAQAIVGSDKTATLGTMFTGESYFAIGYPSTSHTTEGIFDEVAVFNDVLTVDEIDQIRAGIYGAGVFGGENFWLKNAVGLYAEL